MPLQNMSLPDAVYTKLPVARSHVLTDRPTDVDAERWRRRLKAHDLPQPADWLSGHGTVQLNRAEVFAVADQDPTLDNAIQLFWASLAWGLGLKGSRFNARLQAVADDRAGSAESLLKAWQLVREDADPVTCYRALITDRGAGRIHGNGPAFASKYLYFAQGADNSPSCLILDRVVATRLDKLGVWPKAPTAGWYPATYAQYCAVMERWADEASQRAGHKVHPDEIEYALFNW